MRTPKCKLHGQFGEINLGTLIGFELPNLELVVCLLFRDWLSIFDADAKSAYILVPIFKSKMQGFS